MRRASAFAMVLFDICGVARLDRSCGQRCQESDEQGGDHDDAGVQKENLQRLDRVGDLAGAHHAEDRADAEVRHRDREHGGQDHGKAFHGATG